MGGKVGGRGDDEGGVRRMDGPARPEEDRPFVHPHALLRPRIPASRVLQEETAGQRGMCLFFLGVEMPVFSQLIFLFLVVFISFGKLS